MAKKKKKTGLIIVLVIIGILLGSGGVFAYFQANNIKALAYMKQYTPEQRAELLTKNEEAVQKIMEKVPEAQVQPLSPEDEALLKSGEMTEEEALQRIMGKTPEEIAAGADGQPGLEAQDQSDGADGQKPAGDEPKQPQSAPVDAPDSAEDSGRAGDSQVEKQNEGGQDAARNDGVRLQELLARVYLLRSSFTGQIDGLVEQAKAEVIASGNKDNVFALASKFIGMGNSLEAQCDAQMESLLGEISAELQRTGGDTGIVGEIRSAYENEKSIKKAALLDKYY